MKEESFGVIPFDSSGRILLIRSLEGMWGFPKGHSEPQDKDSADTALRELAEETGITDCELVPGKTFTENYSFQREGVTYEKTNTFFIGKVKDTKLRIQTEEISDAKWLDYATAIETISFPEARRVLEAAYLHLTK